MIVHTLGYGRAIAPTRILTVFSRDLSSVVAEQIASTPLAFKTAIVCTLAT